MGKRVLMQKKQFSDSSCMTYVVPDDVFLSVLAQNPLAELVPEDYKPKGDLPVIGILAGREGDAYALDDPYLKAVAGSGADIKLIHYHNVKEQLADTDGLLLTGGNFPTPREWFVPDNSALPRLSALPPRTQAYVDAIDFAVSHKLPMLGICGGMQMMAGMRGGKLSPVPDGAKLLPHKGICANMYAHRVGIAPYTKLSQAAGQTDCMVNSSHAEMILEVPKDKIMVSAISPDGIIEAIEYNNYSGFAIGVQWHPERMALQGEVFASRIYQELTNAALEYRKTRS